MEVEARMKRNYLPPSMQYQSGYQSPPTPTGPPNPVPQSPTQGSITAGTPNYSQNTGNQKSMKPSLQTIPQGSIMGTTGSIMAGTPITQAASPFTPTMGHFSPSHGSVVQNVGSITSGTPLNQGSIMSGTPNYDSNAKTFTFGTNNTFGGMSTGTYNAQNVNAFGSITSGTPMNQGSFQSPPLNQGSYQSMDPYDSTFSSTPIKKGSITDGTPISQNQFQTSQMEQGTYQSMDQYDSAFIGPPTKKGSITDGTPISQNPFQTAQNSYQNNPSYQNPFSSTPIKKGSIKDGTPITTPFQNPPMNRGAFQNQPVQSSMSGSFSNPAINQTFESTPIYQSNFTSDSFISPPIKKGSITEGTPIQAQGFFTNQDPINSYQNTPMGTTPLNQPPISITPLNQAYQTPPPNQGSLMNQSSFPNPTISPIATTPFSQTQGSISPMNQGSQITPSYQNTGSITAGTPLPVNTGTYNPNQYNTKQRKYSGPQRVKLQMLATVQEMGNFYYFFVRFYRCRVVSKQVMVVTGSLVMG